MLRYWILLFGMFQGVLTAQEEISVQRCSDIDRGFPIRNIFIDENNNKWVSDKEGIFLAQSPDFASPVDLENDEISMLTWPDGNAEINISKSALKELMGDDYEQISAAHYDSRNELLLIGTDINGIYQFKLSPELSLEGTLTTGNSKLRSDKIQGFKTLPLGKILVGTDDGMLLIESKKETLIGKYFNIEAIGYHNNKIYVLSENEIFEVDDKFRLFPIDLPSGLIDGAVVDITFDSEGKLWIASEIVVRYDLNTEEKLVFGPAQEFTSQNVNCIAIDYDDALWVGTYDKGVYYIGEYSTMSASIIIDKPLSCSPGATDAELLIRASGGQPPYNYQWNNGLSGNNPTEIGPGIYAVTITDQAGQSVNDEVTIEDKRLSIETTTVRPAGLGQANGQVKLIVSGGNPAYRYNWDNGETKSTATQLAAGEHAVTITDNSGCEAITNVTVYEEKIPLTASIEQTQLLDCPESQTGQLTANVFGGEPPYQYNWSNNENGNEQIDNLPVGTYSLTVTDAKNEVVQQEFIIEGPSPMVSQIAILQPASADEANGIAEVSIEGGNPPFQFKWDNGQTATKATGLSIGSHQLTITDDKGCQKVASFQVQEDILPLTLSFDEFAPVECHGKQTAGLKAKVKGGKPPYTYFWSKSGQTIDNITNLGAGNYQLIVKDQSGQETSGSYTINEPDPLSVTILQEGPANSGAANGIATATAIGGSGIYKYFWDNGETEAKAQNLGAGQHKVTVTDENGCSTVNTINIEENVLPLSANLTMTEQLKCSNDSIAVIEVTTSGGKGQYNYQWDYNGLTGNKITELPAGTYSVTVTDQSDKTVNLSIEVPSIPAIVAKTSIIAPANTNQSDGKATVSASGGTGQYTFAWDNGETTATAEKLSPGQHAVTITDENGCKTESTVNITEDILPLEVSVEISQTVNCSGERTGALSVNINGGKPPYQRKWNQSYVKGDNPNNLPSGHYELLVLDATGAKEVATIDISEPRPINLSAIQNSAATANNEDGKATAKASGGTGNLTYSWDNGANTPKVDNLSPGKHQVTVTDKNGCQEVTEIEITEDIKPLRIAIEQTNDLKCEGDNTAAIKVTTEGGKSPFDYKWNKPDLSGDEIKDLSAGDYRVTITDATGFNKAASITIEAPLSLTIKEDKLRPASNEDSKDGTASLIVEGGSPGDGYTYQWDNGETTPEATNLTFGSHSVTVSDQNGCSANFDFEIDKKIMPDLTASRLRAGATLQVSRLFFEADSTNMTAESYPVLDEISTFLEDNPLVVIEIGGHTNNIPEDDYSDMLSTERAKSVAYYLIDKGIDPGRLVAVGYGKRKPKFSNKTAEGRKLNQRVELKILRIE